MKAGIEAWQRGDYAGAVTIWRPLAEKGDPEAQFDLGQAYRWGRGVQLNLATAKTWYERAANQGQVDAQTTLGLLLFQNGGQADGLKWLKKAAEQDEPRAQLVYGTALVNGDGVSQDPALGYAFVSRAAQQGLQAAQETLEQLDQVVPIADRKRGIALARDISKKAFASTAAPMQRPPKAAQAAKAKPPAAKAVETAKAKPPAQSAPKPVVAAAAPPPKAPPKTARAAAVSGAWRIQLGAFSQKGGAEALYRKLAGKAALSGRHAFYIPVGAITRLQVGPFESKAAAQSACNAVGVACFPVPAK